MKKLLLITIAILSIACSNDESTTNEQDCNCNKVTQVATFNIVGTPQNPAITYHSVYTTVNVCTGISSQREHNTTEIGFVPIIGQCR